MKTYKKEANGKLEIGQVYHVKRFTLTVDRKLCKGCILCSLVCPRNAITLTPPTIDIDESRCDYHGICAVVCPFSAIKIAINGKEEIPTVKKGVFPVLTRDVEIDAAKCPPTCRECAEKCPLGIINEKREVKKELCAGCQICWEVCPEDAVKVTKFIEGSIRINQALCPDGCRACLDVCPVNALYTEDGKVCANHNNCIYCGACQAVCPQSEALEINRTAVRHSPIESGAWYKGLEKLTSAEGLNKELAASRADKARIAVNNLKESR